MASRTIHLDGERTLLEGIASGAIKPGHLVKMTNATADTYTVHATAGGTGEVIVAQEQAYTGLTVDDAYASGDRVFANVYVRGMRAMVRIKAGQNVAKGDLLCSGGDGTFIRTAAPGSGVTVAQSMFIAIEAFNATSAEGLCAARAL